MRLAIDIGRFTAWLSITVFFCLLSWWVIAARAIPAHVDGVLTRFDGTVGRANTTLDEINAPCIGFHGSVTCGTLAQLSQVEKNFGIVAGQTAEQVKQSGKLIAVATDNLNTVGQHVSAVADEAKDTLHGAGQDVHVVLGTADNTLRAARPVLTNAAKTEADLGVAVRDVDAFVTAPELKATLASVQTTSANVAAGSAEATVILRDARKEADALTAPKPWYRRVWSDALHVGELVWDFAR